MRFYTGLDLFVSVQSISLLPDKKSVIENNSYSRQNMNNYRKTFLDYFLLLLALFILSCNNNNREEVKNPEPKIVTVPEQMDKESGLSIQQVLAYTSAHANKMDDSIRLKLPQVINKFYSENNFTNVWSHEEQLLPLADSLLEFIFNSEGYGLFPADYNLKHLTRFKKIIDTDSVQRKNAVLWAKADILMTDASIKILKDIKMGRLFADSVLLQKDTSAAVTAIIERFKVLLEQKEFTAAVNEAEPNKRGYVNLKMGIQRFLDSMDRRVYTYIKYPLKPNDEKDSLAFIKALQKRLSESKSIELTSELPDTLQLQTAIKKYQKLKGIKQDGKFSEPLIKLMNSTDMEKFKRIAVTLDRYKQLPDSMPEKYVWVNLPAYYLELWDTDTLVLTSKIICGKPTTSTPLLTSAITNMVTYPTWTVPTSIISKQYLPKLKNNPYYLQRMGIQIINDKGDIVDPGTIKWAKYTKGIPYKVMQGSGDDNALGVLKFNFNNPYAVYLHDTNQRYLFKQKARALSHGCVRVQKWDSLAFYIARNDSINLKPGDSLRYNADSIRTWIAEKKNKRIQIKNRLPLFITYYSCEGKNGKIKFYDDIYGDDKALREKYFSNK
jgi:L,D-transpeptidase YcbB